jgi:succinylglutamate desuccinylase
MAPCFGHHTYRWCTGQYAVTYRECQDKNLSEKVTWMMNREIADFTMGRPGPLVIAIGALHGNEVAGVEAIKRVQTMLEDEVRQFPGFVFRGRFLGLIGNIAAYEVNKRFIVRDLNRIWQKDNDLCKDLSGEKKFAEGVEIPSECLELQALRALIDQSILNHKSREVVLLDLHTTSAQGGIFSISLDGRRELEIGTAIHAPVVKGLLDGITGTLLHHYKETHFLGKEITPFAFESGSHTDPLSIDRAVSAVIKCMRAVRCLRAKDVHGKHDMVLQNAGASLPKVVDLAYVHKIEAGAQFVMRPGYRHFQAVAKGEHLADDRFGPIFCKEDGLILMPLYQNQGTDGFFIVKLV